MTPISTEQILEDAALCATYLRGLLNNEVPMNAAVQLAAQYMSSHQITRASQQEPPIPGDEWKKP